MVTVTCFFPPAGSRGFSVFEAAGLARRSTGGRGGEEEVEEEEYNSLLGEVGVL